MGVEPAVEYTSITEALAGVGRYTAVVAATPWAALAPRLPAPTRLVVATTLEEIALDRLVADEPDGDTIVGIGGGTACDVAKYLALRTGKALVLVPTTTATMAPYTIEVARRVRRQVMWIGDVGGRVAVDLDLLASAPAARNRSGAADIIATASATWDWKLADARDKGLPFSTRLADIGASCRRQLAEAADAIAAGTPDGLRALVELQHGLGRACARAGHRRLVEGSEHTFAQANEHRLGSSSNHGAIVGLGTVAMCTLQEWYGVSAGGPSRREEAIELLTRCRVPSNPHQLGLDEGTFRGLLRHAVRFHVGEFLPWSVLNEADVNWSAAEEMWRQVWRVPRTPDA